MADEAPQELERSVASDASWIFGLRLFEYCVGFATTVVISRWLGPEGRGLFYLPIAAAAVMAMVCNLALVQANVYLLGTEGRSFEELAGQNGLVATAAGGFGAAAMIGAAYLLPKLFGDVRMPLIAITALSIPIILHRLFNANLLSLKGEVRWQFVANVVGGVVQIGALIALWRFGLLTVATALGVNLAYATCTWALTAFPLEQQRLIRIRFNGELLKSTLRQSVPLHTSTVLLFLHLRADMFMVKWFAGTAALGLYSLAVPFAESILIISDSLAVALNPRQVRRDTRAGALQSLQAVRICLVLSMAVALTWVALGSTVIRKFAGPEFASAYNPFVALLPGLIFLGVQRLCGVPIVMRGRPWMLAAIHCLSLCINVALNLLLVPKLGPTGAALASTFTYALGAILVLVWTAGIAEVSLLSNLVPSWVDFGDLWKILKSATRVRGAIRDKLFTTREATDRSSLKHSLRVPK